VSPDLARIVRQARCRGRHRAAWVAAATGLYVAGVLGFGMIAATEILLW
jgi:hypothetical protein